MLKVLIIVLLAGVVISLFTGLTFLFKDTGRDDSRRTWYALGVRVTLATALLLTISYGFYTGQLTMGVNAPWHNERHSERHNERHAETHDLDQSSSPAETTQTE